MMPRMFNFTSLDTKRELTPDSSKDEASNMPAPPTSSDHNLIEGPNSSHEYCPIPPAPKDFEDQAIIQRPQSFDLAGSWTWEIASAVFSIICLVLLAIFLQQVDGEQYDSWRYNLSPNTVASAIVTIAKAALLISVSSCISQIKWSQGEKAKRSPLYHIQALDQASRGTWGSLEILWRWRLKPGLATAGALLTVLSMAIDPLAQQLLNYPSIRTKVPDATAYAQSAHAYSTQGQTHLPKTLAEYVEDSNMMMAAMNGLANKNTTLEPVCSTGDCEYSDFNSLGICSHCEDVTKQSLQVCNMTKISEIEVIGTPFDNSLPLNCSYTSPTGHKIIPSFFTLDKGNKTTQTLYRVPWTSLATFSASNWQNMSFFSAKYEHPTIFYTIKNTTAREPKPQLTECSIHWCEKQYTNNFYKSNGHRALEVVKSQILTTPSIDSGKLMPLKGGTLFSPGANYTVDGPSGRNIGLLLQSIFSSDLLQTGQVSLSASTLLYKSNNLTESVAQMATAMTDAVRSTSESGSFHVHGEAFQTNTIIHVRWGWIALPIASVILSIILLLATAISERKSGTVLWKASVLPLLLGGVETRPEHDLATLPPHVDHIVETTKSMTVVTKQNHPFLLVED